MSTISSLFAQTSSYESFVSQLVQLESQKKIKYEEEKDSVKESKTAVGTVSSTLSEFEAKIKELTTSSNNSFEKFTSSVSNNDVIKINSIFTLERENTYNITVDRLAKRDIAIDSTRSSAGNELAGFGDGSVSITIGDKTDTVNISTDGLTNKEILEAFADEIASKFGEKASANVFNTNNNDVQFSIQSLETGFDQRIQFSGATGVLAEITSNISKLVSENDLDASFTIDGINFVRGSNNVTDAIDGLDFTLLDATGTEEQMTVSRDITKSKRNLEDFIKAFNEVNDTIRERTFINAETGNKGPLQKYRTIRNLSTTMRQTALLNASAIPNGHVSSFTEIGISFGKNGEMKIEDSDLLENILANNPQQITAFFEDASSPIATMLAQSESFTESGGILTSLKNSLDDKIDNFDRLINREEDYLIEYEEEQRRIFNELDALLEAGQQQFDQVVQFANVSIQAPSYI